MATIRARFVLEDGASGTMAKIVSNAKLMEAALEKVEGRLGKTDVAHGNFSDNWEKRSVMMRKAFNDDMKAMGTGMTDLNSKMNALSGRKVLKYDVDTSAAMAKMRAVEQMVERSVLRRGVGSKQSGMGLAGLFDQKAQDGSRFAKMWQAAARGADDFGKSIDKVGFNLGPFSARLSSLPGLLALIGPATIAPIAGALSVLSTSLVAVGVGAIGAVGILGAFAAGITAIAVPAVMAAKGLQKKNKEIDKNKAALDRANVALSRTSKENKVSASATASYTKALDFANRAKAAGVTNTDKYRAAMAKVSDFEARSGGTSKAYTAALQRRDDALKKYRDSLLKVTTNEQKLNANMTKLKKAWSKDVMNGPSGDRAIGIMSSAVDFATKQMPFAASMMDKFTKRGEHLFAMAQRKAPLFQRNMERATSNWPKVFEQGGKSAGHFAQGLLGVLNAAKPLTNWMSTGLLNNMQRFDQWANGSKGTKQMRELFKDMEPVLHEMGGTLGDLGGMLVKVAENNGDETVGFFREVRKILKGMPDEIDFWTEKMAGAWPAVKGTGKFLLGFFQDIASAVGDIKDGVMWMGDQMPEAVKKSAKALAGVDMPDWVKEIAAVGTVIALTKPGRGLIGKALPGGGKGAGGGIGGALGIPGMGMPSGGLGSPIHVWVDNYGLPGGRPTIPGGRPLPPGGSPRPTMNPRTGKPYAPGTEPNIEPLKPDTVRPARGPFQKIRRDRAIKRAMGNAERRGGGLGGKILGRAAVPIAVADALINADSAGESNGTLRNLRRRDGDFSAHYFDAREEGPRGIKKDVPRLFGIFGDNDKQWGIDNHNRRVKGEWRKNIDAVDGVKGGNLGKLNDIVRPMNGQQQDLLRSMMPKGDWEFAKFIRSKGGLQLAEAYRAAVTKATKKGESELQVGGVKMELEFDKITGRISAKRIDLSPLVSDMWEQFKGGIQSLAGIVTSVTGPLNTFWNTLTGGGTNASNGLPIGMQGPPNPNSTPVPAGAGDGVGFVGQALGAASKALGLGKSRVKGKGKAGAKTAHGLDVMYQALAAGMGGSSSGASGSGASGSGASGSASSATGLTPAATSMLSYLEALTGVHLTSGFRAGAVTEFGNPSLHGMGRAIDVGGTSAQMQATWQALQGRGDIQELIYNGMASYRGAAPVPFTGSDKHTDHVHVGIGDGVGMPRPSRARGGGAGGATAGAGQIQINIGDVTITDGSSYEEFEERLMKAVELAVSSMGVENADGMLE